MKRTLAWTLDRAAELFGDRTAVVDGETRRDYTETQRRVRAVAGGLAGLGLTRGDVVGALMLNSAAHYESWFSAPSAGFVLNDLNYRLAPAELEFIVADSEMRVLIADDGHLETALRLRQACPSLTHVVYAGPGEAPDGTVAYEDLAAGPPASPADLDEEALAAIFYTGGTTGLPKGVMLSHGNLLHNAMHIYSCVRYTPADRYLHAAPMFHMADGAVTYSLTWAGGTHVFTPAFEPGRFCALVGGEGVTVALLVPTMINLVLNHPDSASADFSSLRAVIYGASPMPGELQRRAIDAFACDFHQFYGMTEAAPIVTHLSPEDHRRGLAGDDERSRDRLRSAGQAVVGVRAEVRLEDGVTRAPVGVAGEVFVKGPNVMQGYWRRPDETEHALGADGWYRSGDVAYADTSGYLYIVDRAKDMIISGGENVYSSEVENVLYEHPAVLEAAVVGVPHEVWGEAVHAVVALKPGAALAPDELIAFAKQRIAGFKTPRSVEVRTEPLPKSGAGKILKRELRAPYWDAHTRAVH